MTIDSNNYKQFTVLVLVLVGIGALIVYAATALLENYGVKVPFYIETPSIPGMYALLFLAFDRYLWKFRFFRKIGIVIADDLNGQWRGIVKSSYDNFGSDIPAELSIKQTATSIKIRGVFNKSKSVSVHENFGRSEIDNQTALFYFFRNEPSYDATSTMAMHEGSAKLLYDSTNDSLSGYYYSGRDRNNHGTIEVRRIRK